MQNSLRLIFNVSIATDSFSPCEWGVPAGRGGYNLIIFLIKLLIQRTPLSLRDISP